jgi:hypothetical protein
MVKVFFSYSHLDETDRNTLEKHLAVLKREKVIGTWHDRRIPAGDTLHEEIDRNLVKSNLVLLLVSHEFLASDYCCGMEMKKALEMRQGGVARVIPIILDHCDWQATPLRELRACPQDGKPISDYPNPNKAFSEITQEIRRVVEEIRSAGAAREKSGTPAMSDAPVHETNGIIVDKVRSSNLRIRKYFSDYDKDTFRRAAFEYTVKLFNNSLEELQQRNGDINFAFEKEGNKFSATVYRSGKEIASCLVINRTGGAFSSGITYSHGRSENTMNSLLTVEDDGYALFLVPAFATSGEKDKLSENGAAEFYWSIFMEQLQR